MNFDENIQIEKHREYKVVKDNRLLQCVTQRRYELSVLEQKALGFILSLIKPDEQGSVQKPPQTKYTFDIRLFCKVCNIDYDNGKNYKNVRDALEKLADNGFWLDEGAAGKFYFEWIHSPRITPKSGKITIRISEDVMPYLINLQERFTQYELYQILALKGSYSIALYELFKSHAFKRRIVLGLEEIKQYLGVSGKYEEYKNFRRQLIEPALKEINEYTDINVSWQPIKKGRFYIAIAFTIATKEKWEGLEAYRKTMAELHNIKHGIDGQTNIYGYGLD
jgi:plasmid replication initiation protein